MKKLIFRKVKIEKELRLPTRIERMMHNRIGSKSKGKKNVRNGPIKWVVSDLASGDALARLDSYGQARKFCIKNDYDFGQYM